MEELFIPAARAAVRLIEAAAVLIVTFGSLEALLKLLVVMARPGASHGMRKAIWRRFGVWLLLGLEFALAADIITSRDLAELAGHRRVGSHRRHSDVSELLPGARLGERRDVRRTCAGYCGFYRTEHLSPSPKSRGDELTAPENTAMEETLTRFVSDLIGRLTGPLTLRLFLQPTVAGFFAVRDGLKFSRVEKYLEPKFSRAKKIHGRQIYLKWQISNRIKPHQKSMRQNH